MIEIKKSNDNLVIVNSDKKEITIKTLENSLLLDGLDVCFPGEYEKSGILLEVKEYNDVLYYNFTTEGKTIVVLFNDTFEMKEEILSFFGDVDLLIIRGSKEAVKTFENIEARVVVPYGEGKDIFLNNLGQNIESVSSIKIKSDTSLDRTEFINLD